MVDAEAVREAGMGRSPSQELLSTSPPNFTFLSPTNQGPILSRMNDLTMTPAAMDGGDVGDGAEAANDSSRQNSPPFKDGYVNEPFFIGVAGGTASGKTTTATQPLDVFVKVRAWSDFAARAAVAKSAFFRR